MKKTYHETFTSTIPTGWMSKLILQNVNSLFRKAASTIAKHPERITSGIEARKLVKKFGKPSMCYVSLTL